MSKRSKRLIALTLALSISMFPLWPGTSRAQEEDKVAQLIERMSNAAKVGQLFLVTFPGSAVTEEAAITELIRDYHVGGVVLAPENTNIVNEGDTLTQVANLTGRLQAANWAATQPVTETTATTETPSASNPPIPLFIAVNQEGNGMPFTSIISGTTPLPSEMALGATWNLSHTETVGQIVGRELSALGINVLLGPSLDVLEKPRPESTANLGIRAFGGDPFWVGQMGQAYIRGVHEGSEGRIAVMAKHFPGLGASDRSLSEEISTVQRTLEKLKQVDLAPFFATAQAESPLARPDGMMVSHIRFRGLEGGRFITTRPISVDSKVLQQLLALPELAAWREGGGVTLSDGLGLRALRRFYDPGERSFNGRRIAQEAFLAGNDLLFLSRFAPNGDWEDRIANMKSTIAFFHEKYEDEPSFQRRVDAAVARILRLKLALYGGTFRLEAAQPDARKASEAIEPDYETASAIAREAVTLLSPPSPDLVPSPPTDEDHIVVLTDNQMGQPCATCYPVPYIDPLALRITILRLYGPGATGQIDPSLVSSFSFAQLEAYLRAPPPPTPTLSAGETITPTPSPPFSIGSRLREADWIIFAMLDPTDGPPQSKVVKRFLAERADALRDPHLVVLAYDAPYYLDATEISKLSAYYAAYSHLEPFIEASVRALFGEYVPEGAPPVSVAGINYDLLTQTSPDPEQTIPLYYTVGKRSEEQQVTPKPTERGQPTLTPVKEGQPTPAPRLEKGDQLMLRTGKIRDHNGHVVPDGTPVQFILTYPQEGLEQPILATTRDGVAEAGMTLDRTGRLDISIQADPIPRAVALQIIIQEGKPATVVTPTPSPTPVPTPTLTPTAEPRPFSSTIEGEEEERDEKEPPPAASVQGMDLMLALVGAVAVGCSGYYAMRFEKRSITRALRVALWCLIGGLGLYILYALSFSYVDFLREGGSSWLTGAVVLAGSGIPLIAAWLRDRAKQSE